MKYISTRGKSIPQSFCDILLGGLAPDGGLYVPKYYPRVTSAEMVEWRNLSYPDLAFQILQKFIGDIPVDDLKALIDKTYTPEVFKYCRPGQNPGDITPITRLDPYLYLLGLSNGPTLAFKDIALQLVGNLFEYVLEKRGETINILGATSGDTGSSAEYALRGKKGVNVFMLSPHERMTPFQRAQMYSLQDSNIFNIAVRGVFDDCQDIVKAVSGDVEFKAKYKIGAVNSINWARVVAQIVYYFKAYFAVTESSGEQVSFSVPTGNFGDICAGHVARMMGLPIRQLILATNENNVLDEFFRTGVYRPRAGYEVFATSSPSMDISRASNFERFIFDLVGRDSSVVKLMWQKITQVCGFDIREASYWRDLGNYGIVSGKSTHLDRLRMVRTVWEHCGIMIDPHTADAFEVGTEYMGQSVPMIILETAQAAKFSDTIQEAIGLEPDRPSELIGLENLPQRMVVMDPDVEQVKQFIRDHC